MSGSLSLQNTLVNAISRPKNNPPIADNPSPKSEPLLKKCKKSKPLPTKNNEPITHINADTMLYHVGFSLMNKNINRGMVMHDMFSKNVFLEATVYFNPTNWNIYAAAKKIPAGIQIKYDLLIFLKPLLIKAAIAIIENSPRIAIKIPGEYVSKIAFETTGATPQRTTTPINTRNAMTLIFFIAELLYLVSDKIKTPY